MAHTDRLRDIRLLCGGCCGAVDLRPTGLYCSRETDPATCGPAPAQPCPVPDAYRRAMAGEALTDKDMEALAAEVPFAGRGAAPKPKPKARGAR